MNKLHTTLIRIIRSLLLIALFLVNAGCGKDSSSLAQINIEIQIDGKTITEKVVEGTTVQTALAQAGIILGSLDKTDPSVYSPLQQSSQIKVTRIREEFEVIENSISFERQTMRNESLPEGQTMLIQPGVNGIEQLTYRKLYENDLEVSRTPFKSQILKPAKPEIVMVGVQTPFTAISIPGRLVYLTAGNVWLMESTTGNRRPILTSGDLDGRIFSLSPDGNWLLFTRKPGTSDDEQINSLWMINLSESKSEPVYLRVDNIVHFADWVPGRQMTVSFSTVEPRSTPPGWQANNDLQIMTVNKTGGIIERSQVVETNSGGIYGWWGAAYKWSPDGEQLAYARPDSIGLVNIENGELQPLLELVPLQTRSDWAWVPNIGWANDSSLIYTTFHASSSNFSSDEASPLFDLLAINLIEKLPITLVPQVGMFSYPSPSPRLPLRQYAIAFLQAVFPEQSETSRYHLLVMDRDGSNRSKVFPPEGQPGLEPQTVVWQPGVSEDNSIWIAAIYQGNLWFINPVTTQAQQITGDGSLVRFDWK
ncbi:MAG: G5 domain-containing protein [Anaerolineaceae bacterium]|nr:G5 domain-containing protein [Anaerolineaceae bacterium]